MKESVLIQNKKKININFSFFIKDKVFTISLLLAIASCFIHPPKLEYVNIHVLVSLFSLMIAIKALDEHRVLDKIAISIISRCNSSKSVSAILIFLCFFSSMFVTNDVALLTFVPLTLVISKRTSTPMMETIILLTIAANIGSSLTPMGNPQNLFIYAHYGLNPTTFFNTAFSIAVLGIVALYFLIDRLHGKQLKVNLAPIQVKNRKAAMIWGLVLAVIIMSIFGVISDQIAFVVTLVTVFLFNKKLLMKIDYSLLLTFICLFIFVGNISHTNAVQAVASASLKDSSSVYFSSILLSQLISNVPASILLAEFTTDWKPLLLGVNIGGLGTIIASMASVISYKLYIQVNPKETKKYLLTFSFYNFSFLAFFTFVQYFIL
ncbi:SLC13 family permease [Schinkia azotoformans]|uniref:Transporter n=1 Tax=Schinkia azotoformans LMG 9581 TaxID=1131731 RepID=K6D924_SCHAZ|nr:SLC13 family permease [Schinkia azotoformans]EKN64578.1 transporter [Schinkia azotoformans LMG 9581]MEC1637886.1 SLC13 family permease [Schinkia azotoformans]MEC1944782.1 SLC13 family permease [Schinkia azotoformans]MED4354134.1 SLC13 family permease [Schinkia azotoformans]